MYQEISSLCEHSGREDTYRVLWNHIRGLSTHSRRIAFSFQEKVSVLNESGGEVDVWEGSGWRGESIQVAHRNGRKIQLIPAPPDVSPTPWGYVWSNPCQESHPICSQKNWVPSPQPAFAICGRHCSCSPIYLISSLSTWKMKFPVTPKT